MRTHADCCPACAAEERLPAVSEACSHERGECRLRDLPDGVRTHVRELRGCRHLRSRLYSLGLIPGAEITVRGHGDTGCRVEVRDTCLVLDCESADSILCDEVVAGGGGSASRRGVSPQKLFERRRQGREGEKHD